MKRLLFSLAVLSTAAAFGQVAQSGTPAQIEVAGGKKAKGFLQSLENGILTFQQVKSSRNIPAPVDKIDRLVFYPRYDAVAAEHSFNEGEYSTVIEILDSVMEPYWDYMSISNNMQAAFGMLVKAHLANGNFDQVERASDVLMEGSPPMLLEGQVYAALVALSDTTTNGVATTNGLAVAEKLRGEVASEAAGLYLQACIEQAKGEPNKASRIVAEIVASHGNDLDWMPQTELLSAILYLDAGMTNSAVGTARQVQSIYAGSNIARDAEKLVAKLPEVKLPMEDQPVRKKKAKAPEKAEEPEEAAETAETAEAEGASGQDEMQAEE